MLQVYTIHSQSNRIKRFEKIKNFFEEPQPFVPRGGVFIPETVPNDKLVRGLDYYTDTVFEFVSYADEMGSQNTVLAGGRYDGLVELMGGKPTSAIGFAAGIERLLLMTKYERQKPAPIFVIPEKVDSEQVIAITSALRLLAMDAYDKAGLNDFPAVEIMWGGNIGKRIGKAVDRGAQQVIILGEEEMQKGYLTIKDLTNKDLTNKKEDRSFTQQNLFDAFDMASELQKLQSLITVLDPYAIGPTNAV